MTKVRWPLASITAVICAAALCFSLQSVRTIAAEDQAGKADAGDARSAEGDDSTSSGEKPKAAASKGKKPRKEVAPKKNAAKSTRQPSRTQGAAGQRGSGVGGSMPAGGSGGSSGKTSPPGNANSSQGGSSPSDESSSGDSGTTGNGGPRNAAGPDSKNGPQMPGDAPLPKDVQKVIDIQNKHTRDLMDQKGIIGTATGMNAKGEVVVKVFTNGADDPKIPTKLDGVPVEVEQRAQIDFMDGFAGSPQYNPKLHANRPVAIGVSSSPLDSTCAPSANCYSGTLSCRLKAKDGSGYYALSNNHVFANLNQNPIGTRIMQPSSGELAIFCACIDENEIGTLYRYKDIDFSLNFRQPNRIDAAIIKTTPDLVGRSTLPDGYGTPRKYTIKTAQLGMNVMKYGRTTGFTKGRIVGLNTFVAVGTGSGLAIFAGQITVRGVGGTFAAPGDSGSLVVDKDRFPLGLLFAGGGQLVELNPIQRVLDEFNMEIDGDDSLDFPVPGKSGNTVPNAP